MRAAAAVFLHEHAVIYKLSILEYHIEVSYSSQA